MSVDPVHTNHHSPPGLPDGAAHHTSRHTRPAGGLKLESAQRPDARATRPRRHGPGARAAPAARCPRHCAAARAPRPPTPETRVPRSKKEIEARGVEGGERAWKTENCSEKSSEKCSSLSSTEQSRGLAGCGRARATTESHDAREAQAAVPRQRKRGVRDVRCGLKQSDTKST